MPLQFIPMRKHATGLNRKETSLLKRHEVTLLSLHAAYSILPDAQEPGVAGQRHIWRIEGVWVSSSRESPLVININRHVGPLGIDLSM